MTTHDITRVTVLAAGLIVAAGSAGAQTTRLTLADAIERATAHSESIAIAHTAEARADADGQRVVSQKLPQVNLTGAYSRTLASEFSGAFQSTAPACAPLAVDTNKPVADRVTELERAASCGALGPSLNFGNLPFGQRNIYQLGFTFSQPLYTGGRIAAAQSQADYGRRAATLGTTSMTAAVTLDVTQAFYDAALSDRLVTIAESGYGQANAAYEQARQAFEAGRQPEFEVLRAEVTRDNQRPTMIRARANRDIAYLRLRQLLELPADAPLTLDVDLDTPDLPAPTPFAQALAAVRAAGATADRLPVQQAQTVVGLRQSSVAAARAERRPSAALTSSMTRVGYPSDGVLPGVGDFRTNWSLGAALQVPVFTGGRLKADELTAQANLTEAEAQLKQTRELSVLDAATALQDLAAAEATLAASAGTIEQAERAYQIASLRNHEGLSTQLELSDSRLSLQIAQANRAQAARDVQVARARVALLPQLPVAVR